ncbi:hypothetical protein [Nocardia amamiensis]|uniref:hypothetical protein n=1 Tax=Nocardia amamiensis TaxID=404578 RepID=UPI000AA9A710|nr:hypothetical protein [Nocardia amamiensis]
MYLNGYLSSEKQSDTESSSTRMVPLLEPAQLLQAISGRCTSSGRLVQWARDLGAMHAELIPFELHPAGQKRCLATERIRAGIDRIIAQIDEWAIYHVPRAKSARKHTHSLGEVMSHMAQTYAQAWWIVLHSPDEEKRHQAWFHMGEAREGYAEMVDEIRSRHLQLPLGWAAQMRTNVGGLGDGSQQSA